MAHSRGLRATSGHAGMLRARADTLKDRCAFYRPPVVIFYGLEMADGTKLQPEMIGYCGTPPLPKEVTENPLYDFEWLDGKQVRIGFEEVTDAANACMVGKIVRITCIEEGLSTSEE